MASVNRAYVAASFGLIDDMKHKAKESIRRILGFFMRIEARVRRGLRGKTSLHLPARSNRKQYWGDRRMFKRPDEAHMRQFLWEEFVRGNNRRSLFGIGS